MGMTLVVIGLREPDDKWQAMAAVWDACEDAGIAPPDEVTAFFGGERPDPQGVKVRLDALLQHWETDTMSGYEINLQDLPTELTHLRIYNAW